VLVIMVVGTMAAADVLTKAVVMAAATQQPWVATMGLTAAHQHQHHQQQQQSCRPWCGCWPATA